MRCPSRFDRLAHTCAATSPPPANQARARACRLALALGVLAAGCGGGAGASAVDAAAGPDLLLDCSNPCRCADRGPPDWSGAAKGTRPDGMTDDHRTALSRANRWRTGAGLAPLNGNLLLEKAAANHVAYMGGNDRQKCWSNFHIENPKCAGFTGADPGSREYAAGYKYTRNGEVAAWATTASAESAVDGWLWTPYHRLPFMDHRLVDEGFATDGQGSVMDLGTGVVKAPPPPAHPWVFPVPGDRDVPAEFAGWTEEPTPPSPDGSASWPRGTSSGTVVSMHFPAAGAKVTDHHLYESGATTCTEVAHLLITAANDPNLQSYLTGDAFLYATVPLKNSTEYVVVLGGTFQNAAFTRSWAFTTTQ